MNNREGPGTARADIIIGGGGLIGGAMAIALAQLGFQIVLADLRHEFAPSNFDGRSYALSQASINLLRALGLWDQLAPHASPVSEIKVSDLSSKGPGFGASPPFAHFEHSEITDQPLGMMIEDRHLRQVLSGALDSLGIERKIGVVERISPSQIKIGEALHEADLLIAADGRKSNLATAAGISRNRKDYGQTALVAALSHELPHNNIAHQLFTPDGPLAILPLQGKQVSIVWAVSHAQADLLKNADNSAFIAALRPIFGDFLGAINLIGARWSYPLDLSLATSLTADRFVLVGDAGHGIHPLAGQGLNLGLRDVATLAEILFDARRRGEDPGSPASLTRYARWRRFDIMSTALATDAIDRIFSNENSGLRALRHAGLSMVSRVAPLRQAMMRAASGLNGDKPKLLEGRPL